MLVSGCAELVLGRVMLDLNRGKFVLAQELGCSCCAEAVQGNWRVVE